MPLVTMPNGEVIDVDQNITPEALKALEKQFAAPKAGSRVQPIDKPKKRNPRTDAIRDMQRQALYQLPFGIGGVMKGADYLSGGRNSAVDTVQDFGAGAAKGATLSFDDELAGAASFLSGNGYRAGRDAAREAQQAAAENSPIANMLGEVTGSLAVPVGGGAKAVGMLGVRGMRAANAMRNAPAIAQGVMVGAGQGALNAAGNSDEFADVARDAANGAIFGGIFGGGAGALMHGGQRAWQTYQRTRPENAEREAYEIIARQLGKGDGEVRYTPEEAANALKAQQEFGSDSRVIDLTPSTQALGANLSRKVDLDNAPGLYQMGMQRSRARRTGFGDEVQRNAAEPAGGFDAMARADEINMGRTAAGKEGYAKGGVLDRNIEPTPELNAYLRDAHPEVQKAFRDAYDNMMLHGDDIGGVVTPDGIFSHIPNLRTFDAVKRAMDQRIIEAGVRSPRGEGLSNQLNTLKGILAKANPADAEYQTILATQRDAFQKAKALDVGENVLRRLGTEPRKVLRELNGMSSVQREEARIGILDALINPQNKAARANPLKAFEDIMSEKSQRRVMEFAFGGKGNLGRFERWVRREQRNARSDAMVSGNQSITGQLKAVDDAMDSGLPDGQEIMQGAFAGFGFGGRTGAVSNVMGKLGRIATGTSKFTQDEIAKILMSRGENLVEGTEQAALYRARRQAGNAKRVQRAAKAGQQLVTGYVG